MSTEKNALAISLFSEVLAADQMVRYRLGRVLPKGMEISHFSVLNHLAWHDSERSPAQLAETFNVTRGAMTNTLNRLELAGHVHIRPDGLIATILRRASSQSGRICTCPAHSNRSSVLVMAPRVTLNVSASWAGLRSLSCQAR